MLYVRYICPTSYYAPLFKNDFNVLGFITCFINYNVINNKLISKE